MISLILAHISHFYACFKLLYIVLLFFASCLFLEFWLDFFFVIYLDYSGQLI